MEINEEYGYPYEAYKKYLKTHGQASVYKSLKHWYLFLWKENGNMRRRDIQRMLEDNATPITRDKIGEIEVIAFNDAVRQMFGGFADSGRELRPLKEIIEEQERQAIQKLKGYKTNVTRQVESLSKRLVSELSRKKDIREVCRAVANLVLEENKQ